MRVLLPFEVDIRHQLEASSESSYLSLLLFLAKLMFSVFTFKVTDAPGHLE